MKRSMILEKLYELNKDETTDKDSVNKLLDDVLKSKITDDDAELRLKKLDPQYQRSDFLKNLKGKPIFKNIIEFKKGNLEKIQVAKMVSSLVTQVLIQVEHNPELDPKSLHIDTLLEILKELSESESVINTDKINDLLYSYGWEDSE